MEKPDNCRKYDAAFRTETLRIVAESRSTPVGARALNLDPKLLYKWPRDALPAGPAEVHEERQLRVANRWLAQELEISKQAIPLFFGYPTDARSCYPFIDQQRGSYCVRLRYQVVEVAPAVITLGANKPLARYQRCVRGVGSGAGKHL
ncbi:hypothetical protein GCM10027346_42400 [Hymenobacter seoulensis]